jgi:hypothetical protein
MLWLTLSLLLVGWIVPFVFTSQERICDILAPGMGCPGPRLNRINRVIISTRCIFFFGSLSQKNLQVKRAWLGAIWDGWPTGKFSRVRMSEDKVRTKDLCWSVGTIYDPRELPGVSTAGPGIGRGVTESQYSEAFWPLFVNHTKCRGFKLQGNSVHPYCGIL